MGLRPVDDAIQKPSWILSRALVHNFDLCPGGCQFVVSRNDLQTLGSDLKFVEHRRRARSAKPNPTCRDVRQCAEVFLVQVMRRFPLGASRTAIETPSRLFNDSPQGPGLEGHPGVPIHSSLTTTRSKPGDWSASGLTEASPRVYAWGR